MVKGGIVLLALSVIRAAMGLGGIQERNGEPEFDDLDRLLGEARDARDEAARRTRPLGPVERLDPNQSEEEELDRLPGVGPVVARAIVAERSENGGFRAPEDLLRVPGIGPATLKKLIPHLDFSRGVPLGLPTPPVQGSGKPASFGARRLRTGSAAPEGSGSARRVPINRATLEELQSLPGIGPVLAERIIRARSEAGPFRTLEDLLRVSGIGPATLARIRSSVLVEG